MAEHAQDDVATAGQSRRTTVLYVMGAGRSGSTILGVALGNSEGVFFAGELDRWFARSGVPRGEGAERARLWGEVLQRVGEAGDVFAANTTLLERSSTALDPRNLRVRRALRRRYREVSGRLYRAIAEVSGAGLIVDSSHYPLRAWELRALEGVELHLLLLVRDPPSVVASLGRRDVRERHFGEGAANAYLWLTHLFSVVVFLGHPRERRLLVRHEDFLADPQGVLGEILERCGSDATAPAPGSLRTGAPFHGNRLIEQEEVTLLAGGSQPVRGSLLTKALQWPWRLVMAHLKPAVGARGGGRRERG